jgi:hypothetical protein
MNYEQEWLHPLLRIYSSTSLETSVRVASSILNHFARLTVCYPKVVVWFLLAVEKETNIFQNIKHWQRMILLSFTHYAVSLLWLWMVLSFFQLLAMFRKLYPLAIKPGHFWYKQEYTIPPYFPKIHSNIILLSMSSTLILLLAHTSIDSNIQYYNLIWSMFLSWLWLTDFWFINFYCRQVTYSWHSLNRSPTKQTPPC